MKEGLNIYLVELAHTGFGLSMRTCPLGIGVIASYCKSIHKEDVAIRLFRTIEDLAESCKEKKPDIIGFGYFAWNDYITLAALRMVRTLCPDTLIVLGGSNIGFYVHEINQRVFPDEFDQPLRDQWDRQEGGHDFFYPVRDDHRLLRDHPQIDLIVHGDGEVPFAAIVQRCLEHRDRHKVKRESIEGCSALVEGEIRTGKPAPLLYELDKVPSPYVQGFFTEFFDRFQLVPQIETLRGCPFKCTFCTIGLQSGKLRRHTLEYTKEEILYLKNHSPSKVLRIADPNWGIVKHDVELAEYIRKLCDEEGYPNSLRVYYSASGPFENIKKMATHMRQLLPLNMSFQSLTKEVLKNITRSNMPMERVREMVLFAYENRIATSTELISNLPGETYQSFRECFLKAIDLRIDSIYTGQLYLIKGSELYSHEARQKYGIKTAYALIEKDVTKVNGKYVFEMDEVVTETTTVSGEEFWEIHRFRLFCQISYAAAFLKELMMHGLNYGVSPLDIYDEIFIHHPEEYPFLNGVTSEYVRNIKNLYFATPQALENTLTKHIEEHGDVDYFTVKNHYIAAICKVQGAEEKKRLIAEVSGALGTLFDLKWEGREGPSRDDFLELLSFLKEVTAALILTPLEELEEKIGYESSYDFLAWAGDSYNQPLVQYRLEKPKRFSFVVRNIQEHLDFIEKTRGFSQAQKYNYYFATMVSSNMRRFITYAEEREGNRHFIREAIAPMIT